MNSKKILGLDLGIASIGWCLVNEQDNKSIIDMGVRHFPALEDSNKESLNKNRREKRLARRRLKRRRQRLEKTKELLKKYGFLNDKELFLFDELRESYDEKKDNPWKLRVKALTKKLSKKELIVLLYYFVKHRGFLSNRKHEPKEKKEEIGKIKKAGEKIKESIESKNYQTLGELFDNDEEYRFAKRNKKGHYTRTPFREFLKKELKVIFNKQRKFGNKEILSDAFEKEYVDDIFFQQTPMKDIYNMVGYCVHESKEKRAPKNSTTAELITLHQRLNNVRFSTYSGEEKKTISKEDKELIKNYLLNQKEDITYSKVRKELKLDKNLLFKNVEKKDESKTIFAKMPGYWQIKDIIAKKIPSIKWESLKTDIKTLDTLAEVATYYKNPTSVKKELSRRGIESEDLIDLTNLLNFDKVSNLSFKAMKNILPHLEEGEIYTEACRKAGYSLDGILKNWELDKKGNLPVVDQNDPKAEAISMNPVAFRSVTQVRKVVNAIIKKHGRPDFIKIETGREIGKGALERKNIERGQENARQNKTKAFESFKNLFNRQPRGDELLKYRCWKEQQDQYCIYSMKKIESQEFVNNIGNFQIDHILPLSRSQDDSLNNKVLCYTFENQNKGDKIPYEYFGHDTERWEKFSNFILGFKKNKKIKEAKIKRLLKKNYNNEGFLERNINDTRYISRFVMNYLKCLYNEEPLLNGKKKQRVFTTNGQITGFLRKRWIGSLKKAADAGKAGLSATKEEIETITKNREGSDKHHAIDATIVALTNVSMVQKITRFYQAKELNKLTDEQKKEFPLPWTTFPKDLVDQVRKIFISRFVGKRRRGQIHKETLYSYKNGITWHRVDIQNLTKPFWENFTNESKKYNQTHPQYLIYKAIVERLEERGFDPINLPDKKVFQKSFGEIKKKSKKEDETLEIDKNEIQDNRLFVQIGKKQIPVYTIHIPLPQEKPRFEVRDKRLQKSGKETILGRYAATTMFRIDVYTNSKNEYFAAPLYMSDVIKLKLPRKEIKREIELTDDAGYTFFFSLYRGDLIEFTRTGDLDEQGKKQLYLYRAYYNGFNITNSQIDVKGHDAYHIHRKPYDESKSYEANQKENAFEEIALNQIRKETKTNKGIMASIGIQGFKVFKKFEVNPLGEVHSIKNHHQEPLSLRQEL